VLLVAASTTEGRKQYAMKCMLKADVVAAGERIGTGRGGEEEKVMDCVRERDILSRIQNHPYIAEYVVSIY
jgi:hypothetical protein